MRKYSVLNPARLVKCFGQIIGLEHIFSSKNTNSTASVEGIEIIRLIDFLIEQDLSYKYLAAPV